VYADPALLPFLYSLFASSGVSSAAPISDDGLLKDEIHFK